MLQIVPQSPSSEDSGYTSPLAAAVAPPAMYADIKKDLSVVFEEENDTGESLTLLQSF